MVIHVAGCAQAGLGWPLRLLWEAGHWSVSWGESQAWGAGHTCQPALRQYGQLRMELLSESGYIWAIPLPTVFLGPLLCLESSRAGAHT